MKACSRHQVSPFSNVIDGRPKQIYLIFDMIVYARCSNSVYNSKLNRGGIFLAVRPQVCDARREYRPRHADLTKIHQPRIVRRHRGPRKYRDIATYSFDRQLSLLRYTTTATRRRRPPRCLGRGAPGIGSGRGVNRPNCAAFSFRSKLIPSLS